MLCTFTFGGKVDAVNSNFSGVHCSHQTTAQLHNSLLGSSQMETTHRNPTGIVFKLHGMFHIYQFSGASSSTQSSML